MNQFKLLYKSKFYYRIVGLGGDRSDPPAHWMCYDDRKHSIAKISEKDLEDNRLRNHHLRMIRKLEIY